jgi:hypothetical protein
MKELGIYLWSRILEGLNADYLLKRGIRTMEVIVEEAAGQEATFRWDLPTKPGAPKPLDVRSFIEGGDFQPTPCESAPEEIKMNNQPTPYGSRPGTTLPEKNDCGPDCENCLQELSKKLQLIVDAMNSNRLGNPNSNLTVKDLEDIISKTD